MEMCTRITIENCERDDNKLIVHPDCGGIENRNLIGFQIMLNDENLPLSEKELNPNDGSEEYFHINKAQAKVLISYLQSLVDDM